jgi:hypothetical protein
VAGRVCGVVCASRQCTRWGPSVSYLWSIRRYQAILLSSESRLLAMYTHWMHAPFRKLAVHGHWYIYCNCSLAGHVPDNNFSWCNLSAYSHCWWPKHRYTAYTQTRQVHKEERKMQGVGLSITGAKPGGVSQGCNAPKALAPGERVSLCGKFAISSSVSVVSQSLSTLWSTHAMCSCTLHFAGKGTATALTVFV